MHFEPAEYRARLEKTRSRMYEAGIEVLLVTDPANMHYLTGYDGWSFYVHQGVLVFLDRDQPVWFGRGQDRNGARLTTWLDDENLFGYADDYVQSKLKHPMEYVARLLESMKADRRRVGVEKESYYFTGLCLEMLAGSLPYARLLDATGLVNWVRVVKSQAELALMRQAGQIMERTMRAAIDAIEPGVREGDVAARICQTQISGTDEFTGDYTAIAPLIPSRERTTTAHLSWTDRRYEPGDFLFLELGACRRRYHAPLARTVAIGAPPPGLAETAKVVIDGLNETLAFIRAGVTAEEVEARWRRAIAGSQVVKESRVGYSIGIGYPPDWGEHTISLRPGDKTVLEPDMTLHFMPGIWMDEYGFECTEPIRVTDSGCETFVGIERKLFLK